MDSSASVRSRNSRLTAAVSTISLPQSWGDQLHLQEPRYGYESGQHVFRRRTKAVGKYRPSEWNRVHRLQPVVEHAGRCQRLPSRNRRGSRIQCANRNIFRGIRKACRCPSDRLSRNPERIKCTARSLNSFATAHSTLEIFSISSPFRVERAPRQPFRRNQFGASAGGPLKKDRLFLFGNYEGFRHRLVINSVSVVPNLEARQGRLPNATTGVYTPVANARPEMLGYMALWPLPNGPEILVPADRTRHRTGADRYCVLVQRTQTNNQRRLRHSQRRLQPTESGFAFRFIHCRRRRQSFAACGSALRELHKTSFPRGQHSSNAYLFANRVEHVYGRLFTSEFLARFLRVCKTIRESFFR
jgi:hypothetical protein